MHYKLKMSPDMWSKESLSKNGKVGVENMFLSFFLDGWSVPRRALGNARF